MQNSITIEGVVQKVIEHGTFKSEKGTKYTKFSLWWADRHGSYQNSGYFNCILMGKNVTTFGVLIVAGLRLIVSGKISPYKNKHGGTSYNINANEVYKVKLEHYGNANLTKVDELIKENKIEDKLKQPESKVTNEVSIEI